MKNRAPSTLAVDIGNSCLHIGIVEPELLRCLTRFDLPLHAVARRLPWLVDKAVSAAIARHAPVDRAVIAGGGRGLARTIRGLLREFDITAVADVAWHPGLPVHFHYKKLQLLGVDRIADALYAAAAYPKRNVIIIDAGTAVTVDALTGKGEFLGGVIFPGHAAALQSLHTAAPALPEIDLPKITPGLPGTSTEEGMAAGVVHAIAGGLNLLVAKYRELLGGKAVVLPTGRGWDGVRELVDFTYTECPEMTLIGTGLFQEKVTE
jgi:type III pantothenate kinase